MELRFRHAGQENQDTQECWAEGTAASCLSVDLKPHKTKQNETYIRENNYYGDSRTSYVSILSIAGGFNLKHASNPR